MEKERELQLSQTCFNPSLCMYCLMVFFRGEGFVWHRDQSVAIGNAFRAEIEQIVIPGNPIEAKLRACARRAAYIFADGQVGGQSVRHYLTCSTAALQSLGDSPHLDEQTLMAFAVSRENPEDQAYAAFGLLMAEGIKLLRFYGGVAPDVAGTQTFFAYAAKQHWPGGELLGTCYVRGPPTLVSTLPVGDDRHDCFEVRIDTPRPLRICPNGQLVIPPLAILQVIRAAAGGEDARPVLHLRDVTPTENWLELIDTVTIAGPGDIPTPCMQFRIG
jgi:hypothetical protein